MAFEVAWEALKMVLWFAVLLLPPVYLLDAIRKRVQPETKTKEVALLFGISFLIAMAFYPFIADLLEYAIALETGVEMDLLLFASDMATYMVVLMFIALLYLIVFNKYKE
jgi:hypothetical protein